MGARTMGWAVAAAWTAGVGCGGGAAPAGTTTVGGTERVVVVEAVPQAPEQGVLVVGGEQANFGVQFLSTGFQPDPARFDVTSGGDVDVSALGLAGCSGWVTRQPDVIVRFDQMYGFLRFAFDAFDPSEDATLVINDPRGNWYCNDDAVQLDPMVDFSDATPGQYDVWVGSYQAGAYVRGALLVTEMANVTP